jgi:hypothetical protein
LRYCNPDPRQNGSHDSLEAWAPAIAVEQRVAQMLRDADDCSAKHLAEHLYDVMLAATNAAGNSDDNTVDLRGWAEQLHHTCDMHVLAAVWYMVSHYGSGPGAGAAIMAELERCVSEILADAR